MMRLRFTALKSIVLALGLIGPAQADGPVVVELFTSQGCSSCPPADRLLGQLAKRDDVLPLALHVDYWDYIGWKDEFADPAHTTRQRAYARTGGRRMIYTPQMIVAGGANIEGSRPQLTLNAIQDARAAGKDANIRLSRAGDKLTIRARRIDLSEPVLVQLVRFDPEQEVRILRGENRGRTLTYHNVVTSWDNLGTWDGKKDLNFTREVSGDDNIALILQYRGPGAVIAAAQLN